MRSGWMRRIRATAAVLALAGGLWASGAGAAEVKNVTAKYVWPWGAEIHYEVVGTISTNVPLVVTVTDKTKNETYTATANALSGDTGHNAGAHRLMWDLDKQGVKLQSTNVVFAVEYMPLYCVVDLSAGANATSYPVTYMDVPPSGGFNADAYKTTKMVLRRIESGTFTMGQTNYKYNPVHQVTLTRPFFIGMFEVTQKQYQLVMGKNPSEVAGDMRPVQQVRYDDIRGTSAGTNWPANSSVDAGSFLGKFRARTGLDFDLPTEAQWEYACRAGTTTPFNNGGDTESDLKQLGRYWYNRGDGRGGYSGSSTKVGSYLPNAWELYDMHGNVWEWCLDWRADLGTAAVTDPKGPLSGSNYSRVVRGGGWEVSISSSEVLDCTSYFRAGFSPGWEHSEYGHPYPIGFRLVKSLSN